MSDFISIGILDISYSPLQISKPKPLRKSFSCDDLNELLTMKKNYHLFLICLKETLGTDGSIRYTPSEKVLDYLSSRLPNNQLLVPVASLSPSLYLCNVIHATELFSLPPLNVYCVNHNVNDDNTLMSIYSLDNQEFVKKNLSEIYFALKESVLVREVYLVYNLLEKEVLHLTNLKNK